MAEYGIKQTFPDKLTDSSTTAENGLGTIRWDGAKEYIYVQNVDIAVTLGDSVCAASTADGIVTPDRAGGSQVALLVKGVAIGAIAAESYGWIQKTGNCVVQCDGSVSVGEGLVPHASENGHADSVLASSTTANTEYQVFGFALEDDASGDSGATTTADIKC